MELVRTDSRLLVRDHAFRRVLGLAVFNPTEERMHRLLAEFYQQPDRRLFGLYLSETPVGVVGIELLTPGRAAILHIAVDSAHQRTGVGRYMLAQLAEQESLSHLTAETDREAVEFYRKAGFSVTSLGEKYSGVERFQCQWARQGQGVESEEVFR